MSDVKLVTLNCPNCGGQLSVGPNLTTFACEYCGANVAVSRDGASATLHLLTDGLARIQRGTDKAAAELAIRRFKEELVVARKERASCEDNRRAEISADEWRLEAAKPKRIRELFGTLLVFVAAGIAGLFGAGAIFNARHPKGSQESGLEAAALMLAAVAFAVVVAFMYLARRIGKRRAEVRRIRAEQAQGEERYRKTIAEHDRRVAALESSLAKNRQIADA